LRYVFSVFELATDNWQLALAAASSRVVAAHSPLAAAATLNAVGCSFSFAHHSLLITVFHAVLRPSFSADSALSTWKLLRLQRHTPLCGSGSNHHGCIRQTLI
jgi:hypothetical protein